MTKQYKLFFKRAKNSIDGVLTVKCIDFQEAGKTPNEEVLFDKLHARSGQAGWEDKPWVSGKSPIPYGKFKLWLSPVLQPHQWAGAKGIGEFRYISTSASDKTKIFSRDLGEKGPSRFRNAIGLHPENGYKGSAGCIVLVHNNHPEILDELRELSALLWRLKNDFSYLSLESFE